MTEQLTIEGVVNQINKLRRNPRDFIPVLQKRLATYSGFNYSDATGLKFKSVEGEDAVNEAIMQLERSPPMQEVAIDNAMSACAQKHCDYISNKGTIEHTGEGGTSIGKRLDAFGLWAGKLSEVISVQTTTPEDVVIKWLIDDGIKSRGHRLAILDPNFKKIGVGVGNNHKTFKTCVVSMLAVSFGVKGTPDAPVPVDNQKILDELPPELRKVPDGCKSITVTKRTVWEGSQGVTRYFAKFHMADGSVIESHSDGFTARTVRVVPKHPWPKAFEPPLPFLGELNKPAAKAGGFVMPGAPAAGSTSSQWAGQATPA